MTCARTRFLSRLLSLSLSRARALARSLSHSRARARALSLARSLSRARALSVCVWLPLVLISLSLVVFRLDLGVADTVELALLRVPEAAFIEAAFVGTLPRL